ncbi:hypothetical protein V8F63_06905 [Brevundimonas sp. LF-1]|uniref:S10 family serine carboxypeptidase-like protein n=1 Tax=Brevundimonas sp. LF-1 TaxID=3126100 RepID=UPI0030E2E152
MKKLLVAAVSALALAGPVMAQDAAPAGARSDAARERGEAAIPPPVMSETRHTGVFGGQRIAYRAIAGETYLKDKDGKPLAAMVSYSYIKEGPKDPNRPVTFLWNGGPGSGSLWLHMGAFGPKRVVVPSDAKDDGAAPFPIIDNPESLLDVTDIVFIDPIGTGFSRALGKTDPADYWGVTKDAKSIAEFIRMWLNTHERWNAPKFIGGESYGTTRSAAVINELEGSYTDVSINGILLISSILDFSLAADAQGNEPRLRHQSAVDGGHGLVSRQGAEQARHGGGVRRRGPGVGHRPLRHGPAEGQRPDGARAGGHPAAAIALHRRVPGLSEQRQPAPVAQPLLQGAAAGSGPDHRPSGHPLHRRRL